MLGTLTLISLGAMSAPLPPAVQDGPTWYADYDKAVKVAQAEGKDLLVDFTGSDWCGWCIKLHDEVFQHEAFWGEAQDDFIMVALDFPRSKEAKAKVPNAKRNDELKVAHEIKGFPTVLLMTADGEVYGRTGYKRGGAEAYVAHLDDLRKERPATALKVGSTVPESISLPDLDGKQHSMGDYRGKVVMVHFWSDSCPFEEHGNPIFAAMEKQYAGNENVVMLGIDSNETELGKAPGKDADHAKLYQSMRAKIKEVGYTHTMLADHGNKVADMFAAQSTPHCFVIDQKGVIQYAGALDNDPRGTKGDEATNYVSSAIDAVLAGKTPETTTSKPYGCGIKREMKEGEARPEKGRKGPKGRRPGRGPGQGPPPGEGSGERSL